LTLSLICNDLHSEKVSFRIFSGNDETLFKTKSLEALHHRGSCNNCRNASLYATRNLLKEY